MGRLADGLVEAAWAPRRADPLLHPIEALVVEAGAAGRGGAHTLRTRRGTSVKIVRVLTVPDAVALRLTFHPHCNLGPPDGITCPRTLTPQSPLTPKYSNHCC